MGTHQRKFRSIRLSDTRFGTGILHKQRTNEKQSTAKRRTARRNPVRAQTKAQPSSDQRKKAIVDKAPVRVKDARPPSRASEIPMDKRLLLPIQASLKYDHNPKSISKNAEAVLLHEPDLREPDEAVFWSRLMQTLYDPHPKTRSAHLLFCRASKLRSPVLVSTCPARQRQASKSAMHFEPFCVT